MEKLIITQTDHGVDVLLNGNRVNCINELTIRYTPKQKPKVEINLDAAAEKIEGYLCTKDLERVVCPKCGRVLAYVVSGYDIACPECGARVGNAVSPY